MAIDQRAIVAQAEEHIHHTQRNAQAAVKE
jgi:hypothetical protein